MEAYTLVKIHRRITDIYFEVYAVNPYFCTVKVRLNEPIKTRIESGESHETVIGYYRNVGVRAETVIQVMEILSRLVPDGTIDWDATVVHDFNKVDPTITQKFFQNQEEVIWYRSGRIFFP